MSDDLAEPPSSSFPFGKKMTETEKRQILNDYTLYIEIDPPGGGIEIRDASCLPHPKQRIKDAFVRELLIEVNEKRLDLLRANLLLISYFQEGVGPEPLHALGFDIRHVKLAFELGATFEKYAEKVTTNPTRQQYEHFYELSKSEQTALLGLIEEIKEIHRTLHEMTPAKISDLKRKAEQGDAGVQYNLGLLYASGRGVPQDYAQARQWYEQAAAQGNASAQFYLGSLYVNGQGVPQDYAKAREWYEQAAAQGNADAQYNLGVLYDNGRGVPQDYVKARQWYEQAAAQGNASAQFNIGILYANERGVPQDYTQAREWFKKAAAQGHTMAQVNLGALYVNGQGVPKDYTKARQWYEQAAAQGDAFAQVSLGLLYARGYGVPQDDIQAYMWFNLAAAHSTGDEQKQAADNRDEVARRMTPAQLAEAERLAQQGQAQQFKGC